MPALIEGLKDRARPVRRMVAASALVSFGPAAKDAVAPLMEAAEETEQAQVFTDYGGDLREAALTALSKIGPEARAALPLFRKALTTEARFAFHPGFGSIALEGIRSLGREGEPATQDLIELLKGNHPGLERIAGGGTEIRGRAAECLAAVAPPEKALPPLIAALEGRYPGPTLQSVVKALGEMGPAARDAVPALEEFHAQCQKVQGLVTPESYLVDPELIREALERIKGR